MTWTPWNKYFEYTYIECDCASNNHTFKLVQMDFKDEDPPELHLEVQLYQFRSFWQRLKLGIGYIFNRNPHGTHWDITSISPDQADKIISACAKYKQDHQDFLDKFVENKL